MVRWEGSSGRPPLPPKEIAQSLTSHSSGSCISLPLREREAAALNPQDQGPPRAAKRSTQERSKGEARPRCRAR